MKELFDVEQLTQFEFGAIIITVLVAGLVFGCLLAYALLKRKNAPNEQATAAIKEEFEQYKDKVDDHFNQTSEMFKDVTTQYKKLYDHMAVGAIELSNADTITMPRLEMKEDDVTKDNSQTAAVDEGTIDDSPIEATVEASENSTIDDEPDVIHLGTDQQAGVDNNTTQKKT